MGTLDTRHPSATAELGDARVRARETRSGVRDRCVVLGLALVSSSACTVANRIDVCDQHTPADFQINTRVEDDQYPTAGRAIAALPSGLMAVVWNTDDPRDVHKPSHVRAALMRPDGALIGACGEPINEVTVDSATDEAVGGAAVAVAPTPDAPVYVVWRARAAAGDPDMGPYVVRARILSPQLCPVSAVFTLSDPADVISTAPTVAARADGREALAVFLAVTPGDGSLRVKARPFGIARLAQGEVAPNGCDGRAVPCTLDVGADLFIPTMAPLGDGYVAAWPARRDDGAPGWEVHFVRFDALAAPLGGSEAQRAAVRLPDLSLPGIAVAPSGAGFALVSGATSAMVQAERADAEIWLERFDATGHALRAPTRVNSTTAGPQFAPTVVDAHDGALWIAWTDGGSEGRAATIRGRVLDAADTPLFNAVACERDDFALSLLGNGVRGNASLARATDGSIVAVYGDTSGVGTDAFGYAVRGRRFVLGETAPALR